MNQHETQIPVVDLSKSMQVQPVKTNLHDRIQLWHGPPKIGKTVQANRIPGGSFFLRFEPGHDHIEHIGETCGDWLKFLGVGRALMEAKKRGDALSFNTIIVDTAGEAFRRCQEYILRSLGLEHESDGDYGKGYSMVENEFRRRMVGLCNLGFGVVMISHTTSVTRSNGKKGNAKQEWSELVVDLPKAAMRVIPPMADVILFFTKEHNEVTDEWEHVIKTRGTAAYMAGVRYPPGWKVTLPETIEMSYDKLVELWDAGRLDGPPPPEKHPDGSDVQHAAYVRQADHGVKVSEEDTWTEIESSNILAVRFDNDDGLDVKFKTGDVYRFKAVTRTLYEQLKAAKSVGSYFNSNIKGNFAYEKLAAKVSGADDRPDGANGSEKPQVPAGERKTGTKLERRKADK